MLSKSLELTMHRSINIAKQYKHEEVTIEHLLLALVKDPDASKALIACSIDLDVLSQELKDYLNNDMGGKSRLSASRVSPNISFQKIIHRSAIQANLSGISKEVSGVNILAEILLETDSYAAKVLHRHGITRLDIINYIIHGDNYPDFIISQKNNGLFQSKSVGGADGIMFSQNAPSAKQEPEALKNYCINLNKAAKEGKIDVLIGREEEINRVIEILSRRNKNNPLLVGEPGVGKTAIIEGLAHKIVHKKVPQILQDATIFSLDLGSLLAGTRYRGDFEERVKVIIKELAEHPKAVLFIDEIHNIIGAGSTNGSALDASNLLKPALARGEIKCIGSTTFNEFNKYFAKDKSLVRRFQQVTVEEPSVESTVDVLLGLRSYYEKYHNVCYPMKVIEAAVVLSKRYITDKQLPDKAIDVIDETGAHLAIANDANKKITVKVKDIEETVSRISKVPTVQMTNKEIDKLKTIEVQLKSSIFGQNEAIEALCSSVKLSRAGLHNNKKPTGCYLFAGPTGVGKTELASQFASILNMHMIRIDMSEYAEKHAVAKLIGAPPGYIGYDAEGMLTQEVSKNPYSVVLLDEIEKAHSDIYNILLQIMDYGTLTNSQGKKVSFHNAVIIMTTNAGARHVAHNALGFNQHQNKQELRHDKEEVARVFSPEFINRLDAVIHFKPLSQQIVAKVAEKFIKELQEKLLSKNTYVSISKQAYEYICGNGYDEKNGARAMERLINDKVKKFIANEILFGHLTKGGEIKIDYQDDEMKFDIHSFCGKKKKAAIPSKSPKQNDYNDYAVSDSI